MSEGPTRRHGVARLEDAWHRSVGRLVRLTGGAEAIIPHPGYGCASWVRVRGRVVWVPRGRRVPGSGATRGWRSFVTFEAPQARVTIDLDGRRHVLTSDRAGYLDAVLPGHFSPGWRLIEAHTAEGVAAQLPVLIVDGRARTGIISDIDDTVLDTVVPRPLLAAYNMLLRPESQRGVVRGMPALFAALQGEFARAPVFYVSNGPWNLAGALGRIFARTRLPAGPVMLTDFGPTPTRLFRSGRAHKRESLARLASDFPQLRWILLGDDGQHDPQLYREFARANPGRVRAVGIRQVGARERLRRGLPLQPAPSRRALRTLGRSRLRFASASDGYGLIEGLGLRPGTSRTPSPASGESRSS